MENVINENIFGATICTFLYSFMDAVSKKKFPILSFYRIFNYEWILILKYLSDLDKIYMNLVTDSKHANSVES